MTLHDTLQSSVSSTTQALYLLFCMVWIACEMFESALSHEHILPVAGLPLCYVTCGG